jgi:hypothetical protein
MPALNSTTGVWPARSVKPPRGALDSTQSPTATRLHRNSLATPCVSCLMLTRYAAAPGALES